MEITKIIGLSNATGEIVIERQTLFCKAVEQSAWRFCLLLKPYLPVKQYVKKVGMPVVTIGLPYPPRL
jgi:hypothetical protein